MKFFATSLPTGRAFISENGEFKSVNYGGNIHLYKKIKCFNKKTRKKYEAFGNSVKYDNCGNPKTYNSYRKSFKDAIVGGQR